MSGLTAELMIDARARLGEGLQLFPEGSMWWVDIPAGRIHRIRDGKSELVLKVQGEVSKVLPWELGFLVFGREQITGFDSNAEKLVSFPVNSPESNLRCSDACVLPDGSVVFGTIDRQLAEASGSLIYLSRKWETSVIERGLEIPNGLGVLPGDGGVLFVDSTSQTVFQYTLSDSGPTPLTRKKVFGEIDPELGVPDGLAMDSEGGCWIALWGGGRVIRLNQRGEIDCQIQIPTPNPTSCAFDNEHNLWITSATETLIHDDFMARGAGGVWMVSAEIHGAKGLTPHIAKLKIEANFVSKATPPLQRLSATRS